jgi:hypothetical protein
MRIGLKTVGPGTYRVRWHAQKPGADQRGFQQVQDGHRLREHGQLAASNLGVVVADSNR